MHIQLYSTTNHIIWHIANGVSGIIYIIVAFVLYPYIGVFAFPVGMIAGYIGFYAWYSAGYSYRAVKMSFFSFEKDVFIPPAVLFIFSIFLFGIV